MLKGCHSNFQGIVGCLLLLTGMSIHLNAVGEILAATPDQSWSHSLPLSPILIASVQTTNQANPEYNSLEQDQPARSLYSYDLGPFDNVSDVDEIVSYLEKIRTDVSFSERDERQPLGYIVVSRRFGSAADIREMMEALSKQGIDDTVYVRTGDYAGRISMGVYSTEANAQQRQMSMHGLGFDVEIIQRSRRISQWWIHFAGQVDEELLLADIRYQLGADHLSLQRHHKVVSEPEPMPAPGAVEVPHEATLRHEAAEPVPETVSRVEETEPAPEESSLPSPPESADDTAAPASPGRQVILPADQKDRPSLEAWLILGLVIFVAALLAWYVIRRKYFQQIVPPSPLTALVSSTLNERDEGILVLDNNQIIVLANKAFSQLVGKSSEELKGQKLSALGMSGDDSGSVETLWGAATGRAAPRINVRVHLKRANTHYSTFLTSTSPLLTEDGAVSGMIVSFRPVLELDESREDNGPTDQADFYRWSGSEYLERINPANQAPLQAILGYAELLEQKGSLDPVEEQNFLNTISADGSRLVNMLGTVLELSRHHSGSYKVEKIAFSPLSVIEDIVHSASKIAADKNSRIVVEGMDNLPESIISDPVRLRRILSYLSNDAIRRTHVGDITLSIRENETAAAGELLLEITDQSTSLADTDLEDKYHYLEQLAFDSPGKTFGNQLDLLIARQLVHELGGSVTVRDGSDGSVCFSLSIPFETVDVVSGAEDQWLINEQLLNEQLAQAEALAREEAASRASAEEQVNQERQARSSAEADARRATEARLVAEEKAAREAEQKDQLKAKLLAEEDARRALEEQAKAESAARLSVEVDLLEAARQKGELQAAVLKERSKRGKLAARAAEETRARKDAEHRLQATLEGYQGKEDELAAKTTAEAEARKDAELRLDAERKMLEELQARLNEETEARRALESRGKAEADALSKIESSLAQERLARQELEGKLQEQLAASQALSVTIQEEGQALADIEAKLAAERVARAELEEKLRNESTSKAELATKIQSEAEARQVAEQNLILEREEKQSLHTRLQAEAEARQELAERITSEERARETAQRALEGKRETVLELEEKLRVEAAATAELLARTRSETDARQALGRQLEEEQEARARLESSPHVDPELQASLDEAVSKNLELQQTVEKEAAAREQAEQSLALEIDARKNAETRVETEHQLNLKAQAALDEERQARLAAEQKVKTESLSDSLVESPASSSEQGMSSEFDVIATEPVFETVTDRPFQIVSSTPVDEAFGESTPPLLTDRLEPPKSPEPETEFSGDKSQRAEFVARLGEQLATLDTQWERQDLEEFAAILRWMSRHTELFGFRDILEQINDLVEVVESEAFGLVPGKLRYIKRLYSRIEGVKATTANVAPTEVAVAKKPLATRQGKPGSAREQSDTPVRSSLNISNPTIQRLVKRSAIRLHELLEKMDLCYQNEDLKELVKICYRLRGEADISGLKEFVSPARQLEHFVKTGQVSRIENQLLQLRQLLDRLEVPDSIASDSHADTPLVTGDMEQETVDMEHIHSTLNLTNSKLKSRVRQFVVRLGSQLTELGELTQQKNYDELTRIASWILNYSKVMGFEMIGQLAQSLVDSVESRNDPEISNQVDQLRMLFSRIEI